MNDNVEDFAGLSADAVRDSIVEKIEAKKGSVSKADSKREGLKNQIEIYEAAIIKNEEKIVALRNRIDQYKESLSGLAEDDGRRGSEVEHMEEILERYDLAVAEKEGLMAVMKERIESVPDWVPGMDESLKAGLKGDKIFQEARTRKLYLDDVTNACLSDVRKIFVSRGVVSEFNTKGREGV